MGSTPASADLSPASADDNVPGEEEGGGVGGRRETEAERNKAEGISSLVSQVRDVGGSKAKKRGVCVCVVSALANVSGVVCDDGRSNTPTFKK